MTERERVRALREAAAYWNQVYQDEQEGGSIRSLAFRDLAACFQEKAEELERQLRVRREWDY